MNAGLPKVFCAEVVNMTCYIIKRLARFSLDGKLIEQVLIGKEVDYFFIRIFGYPAYVHILSEERPILDSKSKKCIFLGLKKGVKRHMIWDQVAKKVVISRDVIFEERKRSLKYWEVVVTVVIQLCKWS